MSFPNLLLHLFVPHPSNNLKSKLLHSSSILIISLFLLIYQAGLFFSPKTGLNVLGYSASISIPEVIRLTNEKRVAAGLSALETNELLSQAARNKGEDMLSKDYWAHVSPDGTEPWKFFSDINYKYKYAGENLARDFSSASSAVDAWMASPSHRENILSSKYREIGVATVEGDLAGADTTIIVQFFGTRASQAASVVSPPQVPEAKAYDNPVDKTALNLNPTVSRLTVENNSDASGQRKLISPFNLTKSISLTIIGVLLIILLIDGIIVNKKNYVRISGRTFAHFSFFGMIFAVVLILKAGRIL